MTPTRPGPVTPADRTPDLLDVLGHTESYERPDLPEGHVYGWRAIAPDHWSRRGYRWPWPGQEAVAPDDGRDLSPHTAPGEPCPSDVLGGLCVAKTWWGARSGGTPAQIGMLLAHRPEDVLGEDDGKRRVARCVVLDVVDVTQLNLSGAHLTRAYLTRAHLTGAHLGGANLGGANLGGANLDGANLGGAYLSGARRWSDDPPIPGWTRTDNGTLTLGVAE